MSKEKGRQLSRRAQKMYGIIEAYLESGLTQHAFCKDAGISYSTFHRWLSHYRSHRVSVGEVGGRSPAGGFIALNSSPAADDERSACTYEIVYPNGVVLRLAGDVRMAVLKALLGVEVD